MLSEQSLRDFVEVFWPEVEPANELVFGWPLEAICEHLEAVTDGEIKRLLFNVPPGFMKSMLCNVFWPAWEWGPRGLASNRFIAASYSQNLTIRDNIKFRNIIMSDLYQEFWGDVVAPDPSQFTTIKVGNTRTGWKIASSVTGTITGERGDRFVIDDPNAVNEVESDSIRDSTNTWFRETVPTRLNKQDDSAIVVVQQRVHEVDVTGTILDLGLPYTHVCIPMEYDSQRHCQTFIGWDDPRGLDDDGEMLEGGALDAADGTLAWPERFSAKAVANLKATLGPYASAGQLNQSPSPRGGGIFKSAWWKQWPPEDWPEELQQRYGKNGKLMFPDFSYVIASLDPALTESQENDFSALTIWGVWRTPDSISRISKLTIDGAGFARVSEAETPKIMLMYGWQKRLQLHGPPEYKPEYMSEEHWNSPWSISERMETWGIVETVAHYCRMFKVDHLLIENKAGGHHVTSELQQMLSRWDFGIELVDPGRHDKVARAHSVVHLFSNEVVYAPVGKQWCDDIVMQAARFPRGKNDDLVDSMTQALQHLRDTRWALRKEESEANYEDELRFPGKRKKLYDT